MHQVLFLPKTFIAHIVELLQSALVTLLWWAWCFIAFNFYLFPGFKGALCQNRLAISNGDPCSLNQRGFTEGVSTQVFDLIFSRSLGGTFCKVPVLVIEFWFFVVMHRYECTHYWKTQFRHNRTPNVHSAGAFSAISGVTVTSYSLLVICTYLIAFLNGHLAAFFNFPDELTLSNSMCLHCPSSIRRPDFVMTGK